MPSVIFRISFWKFGPTELRILLALGSFRLMHSDFVTMAGSTYRLFDIGGVVAIIGLVITFVVSAVANTRKLYAAEPLPGRTHEGSPKGLRYTSDSCSAGLQPCPLGDAGLGDAR